MEQQKVLIPLHDKVIIEPEQEKTKTASGMDIPEGYQEPPCRGKVLAHGPGTYNRLTQEFMPVEVRKGDTVLYQKNSGTALPHDGNLYLIMPEGSIQAIVGRDAEVADAQPKGDESKFMDSPENKQPTPLFTIVLEEDVKAEGLVADLIPSSIYQSEDGEASKVRQGGRFLCKRTGGVYVVGGISDGYQEPIIIGLVSADKGNIHLLAGDKLDYYPPVTEVQ